MRTLYWSGVLLQNAENFVARFPAEIQRGLVLINDQVSQMLRFSSITNLARQSAKVSLLSLFTDLVSRLCATVFLGLKD